MPRCACRWRTISCDERRRHHTRVRLDKWLWAARFHKTRALAAGEIAKGRVEVNGQAAQGLARGARRRCHRDPPCAAAAHRHGRGPEHGARAGAEWRGSSTRKPPRASRSAKMAEQRRFGTEPARPSNRAGRQARSAPPRRVGPLERQRRHAAARTQLSRAQPCSTDRPASDPQGAPEAQTPHRHSSRRQRHQSLVIAATTRWWRSSSSGMRPAADLTPGEPLRRTGAAAESHVVGLRAPAAPSGRRRIR